MSGRFRVALFVLVAVGAVAATTTYVLAQRQQVDQRERTQPSVAQASIDPRGSEPRIIFRHTGADNRFGLVATVPLSAPRGPRAFTDTACDRVAAWDGGASCLVTVPGVITTFEARELDADWEDTQVHPLPGIPSRTRVSPDGSLVATTTFVAGHSYMSSGFSTVTEVRETGGGKTWGNLEEFTLVIDGRVVRPVDRNVWGVTFAEDTGFYATVGTGGRTWLVRGDLDARTLTSVTEGAECPALSPDGTRVAFKVDVRAGAQKTWALAVLDLATDERTLLDGGPRGVDDQVTWLDDDTLLYGMPRPEEPGVTDVWALDTRADARPRLLVEQAWSPTVVR